MVNKLIVIFHIFFVLSFFSNPADWVKPTFKKVQVHFKSSVTPQISKNEKRTIAHKKQSAPSPAAKPPIKKQQEVKKVIAEKTPRKQIETKKVEKTTPKTKQSVKASPKESSLEQNHKETIAKIFEKIDKLEKITNNEPIAAALPFTQNQASQDDEDSGEISDVIQYLFEILELPGPGQVTVEMFLTREGKVDKINILQSENPENSQYLMTSLKDIVLPFHKKGLVPSSMKVCFSNLKA